MLEREARKKNITEMAIAMALYAVVLVVSIKFGRPMEAGTARTLALMAPVIPLLLAVWAIVRQFGRMDEFVRLRSLESFAAAAGITAALTFSYGFLETAGYPKLSMFAVWSLMGISWAAVGGLRCLVRK